MRDAILRQMLYPAPPIAVPSPPPAPLEEVALSLPGGDTAAAWAFHHPAGGDAGAALLVLHGNGENLETLRLAGLLAELEALGVSFLAVDYPGYGRSTGEPSEEGNVAAAVAGLEWLAERRPQAPRVVWGWSLGAAVGLRATARQADEVAALVLLSAWTTLKEVAEEHFPAWLAGLVVGGDYDSLAAAARVRCPSLVVHGEEDEIIPAAHGRRLAGALPHPSRFVPVPGAGHNDLLGHAAVWRETRALLRDLATLAPGTAR